MNRLLLPGWLIACIVSSITAQVVAQDAPQQAQKDIARYPGRGLSPLYLPAGEECRRILTQGAQWEVLPRAVTEVLAAPDESPCFEMHNGDTYYNDLFGNAEALRWTAEKPWDGLFRLLYNTSVLAHHRDDFCLTVDGWLRPLKVLSGKDWRTYQPSGASNLARYLRPCGVIHDPLHGWWIASDDGLLYLDEGQWQRVKIPGWPGGGAEGVVCDDRGRIVAWSRPQGSAAVAVAFRIDGKWSSRQWPRSAAWKAAGIRPDGTAVLAGPSQIAIVGPPGATAQETEAAGEREMRQKTERSRRPQFALGDGVSVEINGIPAIGRDGIALFAATKQPGGPLGLVRLPTRGAPEWFDLKVASGAGLQIAPAPDQGFLVVAPRSGIYSLAKSSHQLARLADASSVLAGDRLLGCDREGRGYLKRGKAIVVFSPKGKTVPAAEVHRVADAGQPLQPNKLAELAIAALDSTGGFWFIAQPSGDVMVPPPGGGEARLRDDRLTAARSLWPGRNGSMLILFANGRAALACQERQVQTASSLVELAQENREAMLAAAPLASRDDRRILTDNELAARFPAAPWLATGDCLWVSDGKGVYRFRPPGKEGTGTAEPSRVLAGEFSLIGPLRHGHLLLAKYESGTVVNSITSWTWVAEPGGRGEMQMVTSPPEQQGGGFLTSPERCDGQYYLDADGWLWLHQGVDRVYRVDGPGGWPMLTDFGLPEFDYPRGYAWGLRSARVFPGYEVGRADFRRSCIPAYREHLTPLFGEGGQVVCLTPDGLAVLRFDPDKADGDTVVRTIRIGWGAKPAVYLGRAGGRVYFIVGGVDNPGEFVAADVPPLSP